MTTSRPPIPGGQSRRGRLALVAALYCTQNLSLGFFTYAFLTIAQARGVPLALIGAAAGIATLLTLKFLWAPVVDRFGSRRLGHYRGWLLLTQSLLAIGCASLALFDPATQFTTLLALFAVIFVVAATQDVAADAAATRLLRPDERGLGNGFQSAGSSVAQVVGGGVVLVVYQAAGWQIAALCLAACTLVALPFVLRWREEADERDVPAPRVTLRTIGQFFGDRRVRWWSLALIPAYSAGFTIAYNLVRPMLVTDGWDEATIGLYVVIGGSLTGVAAGILAGVYIARIGRRPALLWLGGLQVLATFGTLPIALGATWPWLVLLVVALSNAAFAAAFAIIYTISMDLTRPESAGTDFTLFTTITSLLMVISGGSGLALAGTFGFVPVILGAGVLSALGLTVVVWNIGRVLDDDIQNTHHATPSTGSREPRGTRQR
ncbi:MULTISPECIES: MFS transporter [Micrococcales]|uniref:AmpG permease n=1 Tax=Microbacterium esteraromaticum TaxID=57043 RepID=A0A1R4KSI3_9MICO|nr:MULTISPECIES: MFS transporter [Micrococcales]SJN47222.1 AmpG permease [Microbacterium esteraromaticum]SMX80353.1 Predicted arabinose efflux permease, MFS family [Brevibacterium sp. Mu109]